MTKSCFLLATFLATSLAAENWPQWRGPSGNGVTGEAELPLKWSATENVTWRVPMPDRGNSTPVIWGDRIFLTQYIEKERRRTLMCLDRKDGRVRWQQGVVYEPNEPMHPDNPPCSGSPATDGKLVVACFASAGVFCYDFDGKELWRRDLGKLDFEFGPGTSPVIHGDLIFLYRGPDKNAFTIALDKRTGKTVWKVNDPPVVTDGRTDGFRGQKGMISSYCTPIVVTAGGREELIVTVPGQVMALEPKTGKALWNCHGLNPLVYTAPMAADGIVVAMGGFFGNTIAVKVGGTGDVTESRRLWQTVRTKNRLGTGVIHGDHFFVFDTENPVECIELKTGKSVWQERLTAKGAKTESWSSMVLSGDRIYILNQSAETFVIRAAPTFELLAVNALDGALCNSSHAVSDGQIFIRTHRALWCIGKRKP